MKRTEDIIRTLISEGVTQYFVGGAVGYDTLVAELLFRLREEFSQIEIILAYPFDGFTNGWTDDQRATYDRLFPQYDKRVCITTKASREAFWLVIGT